MAVKAVRVSKTSFKQWYLHGPVDQALKTSTQAEQVKPFSLHLDDVHGNPVDCELWVNTSTRDDEDDEPNPAACEILARQALREKGLEPAEVELLGAGKDVIDNTPDIKGVAILTGLGGTDFPEEHIGCILSSLMGRHKDEESVDLSDNDPKVITKTKVFTGPMPDELKAVLDKFFGDDDDVDLAKIFGEGEGGEDGPQEPAQDPEATQDPESPEGPATQ